jgi:predicted Fe-Mo cluster-binding NifX family protein
MKIAVAVTKKGETSPISDQPGRAAFFLVFDEEGRLLETLKNPFSRGGGGACVTSRCRAQPWKP